MGVDTSQWGLSRNCATKAQKGEFLTGGDISRGEAGAAYSVLYGSDKRFFVGGGKKVTSRGEGILDEGGGGRNW